MATGVNYWSSYEPSYKVSVIFSIDSHLCIEDEKTRQENWHQQFG